MDEKLLQQLLTDRKFRRHSTHLSHYLFFHLYFRDYVKYPTAKFHRTIFRATEKENLKELFIMAFRGSAKSTIVSMSYPIWAIIGLQQKKFIIIISQTQSQSRILLNNIRRELDSNELLINDFGPFNTGALEWSSTTLDIPQYGARIICASTGESIRGLRHGSSRPDLIILDDVEDKASVKTFDGRDKIYQWFTNEVLPLGDLGTRLAVVGNRLHDDSLMMKLKEYDENVGISSAFLEFPLIDQGGLGEILWPEKFTPQAIEDLKRSMLSSKAFEQEYLLLSVPDDEQVIRREWIQTYHELLPNRNVPQPRMILIAIDLAIKKGDGRDFTALVPMYVTGYDKNLQTYVLPYIVNKQLDFPETVTEVLKLNAKLQSMFKIPPKIYVESVGYQDALVQHLFQVNKLVAEPIGVGRLSKPERLNIVSPYVQASKVFFFESGMEGLINQLLNIYSTKHDDMADAFTLGLGKVIESDRPHYEWTAPVEERPRYERDPFTGEYRDMNKSLTAGMLDMVF